MIPRFATGGRLIACLVLAALLTGVAPAFAEGPEAPEQAGLPTWFDPELTGSSPTVPELDPPTPTRLRRTRIARKVSPVLGIGGIALMVGPAIADRAGEDWYPPVLALGGVSFVAGLTTFSVATGLRRAAQVEAGQWTRKRWQLRRRILFGSAGTLGALAAVGFVSLALIDSGGEESQLNPAFWAIMPLSSAFAGIAAWLGLAGMGRPRSGSGAAAFFPVDVGLEIGRGRVRLRCSFEL